MTQKKSVWVSVMLLASASLLSTVLVAQMGGPGGPSVTCTTWSITSPANGSNFSQDVDVSCSGDADDGGLNWECRITQVFAGSPNLSKAVAGTSTGDPCDAGWAGTVAAPGPYGWSPVPGSGKPSRDASVTLKHGSNIVASCTITLDPSDS